MLTATPTARKPRSAASLRAMSVDQIDDLAESLSGRPVPGVRMSEREFVAWCPTSVRAEWVDGEVVLMAPTNLEHSDINLWLIAVLRLFVEDRDLGVIRHDVFVRFASQRRRRVPDLLFVSKSRLDLLRANHLEGAPDLMVEIISPDSQSRDRREKFQEYEKAGVREYWIIDPLSQTVEWYRLQGKKFQLVLDRNGVLESSVLAGFRIKSAAFFQKPLPKVSAVLKQMRRR